MAPTDWVCGESFPLHRWHIFLQCFSWQKGRGISLEALFYKVTNPIEKPKNRCFWTVVLEKTLESPLSCKEIQLVHPKGNQSWLFFGRTDVEAEVQYFGHLIGRTDSFEKTLMLRKFEGRREKDDRQWDGWIASAPQWTWVWVNFGSWWWTGRPGVL